MSCLAMTTTSVAQLSPRSRPLHGHDGKWIRYVRLRCDLICLTELTDKFRLKVFGMFDWLTEQINEWLTDFADWLSIWLTEQINEWLTDFADWLSIWSPGLCICAWMFCRHHHIIQHSLHLSQLELAVAAWKHSQGQDQLIQVRHLKEHHPKWEFSKFSDLA